MENINEVNKDGSKNAKGKLVSKKHEEYGNHEFHGADHFEMLKYTANESTAENTK